MNTHTIRAHNVNDALAQGLHHLKFVGELADSRNGRVLRAPGPVITHTARPEQRVLINPLRDANPFFHLAESMWMLAGSNLAAPMVRLVGNMASFSDDALVFHGAYGHRWRNRFGYDQLLNVIKLLQRDPTTRRAVIAMWDPNSDLDYALRGGLDTPCNTHLYFGVRDGALNMTVCCRSNDAVWGAHGANAVHFSVLQEFVALASGLKMGEMVQVSNDYHVYLERPDVQRLYGGDLGDTPVHWSVLYDDHLSLGVYVAPERHVPILMPSETAREFLEDCTLMVSWLGTPTGTKEPVYSTLFFQTCVAPMLHAYLLHKEVGQTEAALKLVECVIPHDWRFAAQRWLERRALTPRRAA